MRHNAHCEQTSTAAMLALPKIEKSSTYKVGRTLGGIIEVMPLMPKMKETGGVILILPQYGEYL